MKKVKLITISNEYHMCTGKIVRVAGTIDGYLIKIYVNGRQP